MMTVKQVISIISAVGVGAIISTILTFIQANKRNNLDFITKERSEWRRKLKQILIDLRDESKREPAIIQLKSQINPYGRNMDFKGTRMYFMKDGHIWDLLNNETDKIDFDKLSLYVNLLLKYDWERSKREIRITLSTFFDKLLYVTLLLASFYTFILAFKSSWIYVILSIISIFLIFFQPKITKAILKNENELAWIFTLLYVFPYIIIILLATTFNLLKISFGIVAFVGLLAYKIYFLNSLVSIENDYIKEVERHVLKNQEPKECVRLSNTINLLENRIFDSSLLLFLQKKRKKLLRKLIRQKKPNFLLHPKLYLQYRNNKKRIAKIVKKLIK